VRSAGCSTFVDDAVAVVIEALEKPEDINDLLLAEGCGREREREVSTGKQAGCVLRNGAKGTVQGNDGLNKRASSIRSSVNRV
jgi:hypothetical protein